MTDQLTPTILSDFIRLGACERFLHFKLHPAIVDALQKQYGTFERPIARQLKQAGQTFEQEVVAALAAQHTLINLDNQPLEATIRVITDVRRAPTILAQAHLEGTIGTWTVTGRADLIELFRDRHGQLHALIADVKASREERLEHRVQVATYALLLEAVCRRAELPLDRIVGAVVHRGRDAFTTLHDPTLRFDLAPYRALVERLVADEDGPLQHATRAPLDDLPYALAVHCDGCRFDTICLPRSAERADLALLPEINRALRSALAAHDIRDLHALAALKTTDATGTLQPNPEHRDRIALLIRDPVVAPHLDHLIARSQAILRRFEPTIRPPAKLPDRVDSLLPDRGRHPHTIQLFLDFQADDPSGYVYLAAALVRGPNAERIVLRMSDAAPTSESEAALLHAWAIELERTIRELATTDAPPLHLLVYDGRAQRIALEACARVAPQHPLLAVLVTWLQQQPQIERATCARLRDVVRDQRNLKLTCDSLYEVAKEVWVDNRRWDWKTPYDFTKLFGAGIFDNIRPFMRVNGDLHAAQIGAASKIYLESNSRFSSQLPSEYAHNIWQNPDTSPNRTDLLAFAEHRLRSLAHIAAACRTNRRLDVPLLPLDQLPSAAGPRDLRSALIAFMELEHSATLADLLAHLRLPIERRVLTGRTALLEAIAVDHQAQPPTARFRFARTPGSGIVPTHFKAGDFAVLNELDDHAQPWALIRGRIVVVGALSEETIELELTALNAAGDFKYQHDSRLQVQLRCRYTLDEMADDLLGDRVRAALDHLDRNPLARWLGGTETGDREQGTGDRRHGEAPHITHHVPRATYHASLVETSIDLLATLPMQPTTAQCQVIADGADKALRLVQGPPGSGKSRTLGLAVVARLLAAAQEGRGLRIAVTAKTHSAVQVALDSIARAWHDWSAAQRTPPLALTDLPIVKIGGSAVAPRGNGVRWADPRKSVKELRALIAGAVVIGGTPGGLSTLLDTIQKKTRWDGLFDLLLIDEASQMSLPEGLLAASTLHEHGQMLVVGDHRQMPPIITHEWTAIQGPLAQWQPERSLFKWLLDAHAPVVALDESFRLHRDHAAFLQDAIYRFDGINFHSNRTALLPPHTFEDPFVDAALRWNVPLVVIEHAERGSRQANDLEAALVADLVRGCVALGLDGRDGIGVVVPHRAQKAALRARLPELADADSIDTVERFQGGERDVIIVACTASDPDYIAAEAEFLMDPQRLNVALSRARRKLIVVAGAAVFDALPTDLALFERAALWKRLRSYAAPYPLWQGTRHEYAVRVSGPTTRQES